jgi:hypothetical protein
MHPPSQWTFELHAERREPQGQHCRPGVAWDTTPLRPNDRRRGEPDELDNSRWGYRCVDRGAHRRGRPCARSTVPDPVESEHEARDERQAGERAESMHATR